MRQEEKNSSCKYDSVFKTHCQDNIQRKDNKMKALGIIVNVAEIIFYTSVIVFIVRRWNR